MVTASLGSMTYPSNTCRRVKRSVSDTRSSLHGHPAERMYWSGSLYRAVSELFQMSMHEMKDALNERNGEWEREEALEGGAQMAMGGVVPPNHFCLDLWCLKCDRTPIA